jgi:hypothetical protein
MHRRLRVSVGVSGASRQASRAMVADLWGRFLLGGSSLLRLVMLGLFCARASGAEAGRCACQRQRGRHSKAGGQRHAGCVPSRKFSLVEDLRSRFALPLMATAAASSTVVRLWQPQRPDELLHVKPPSWSRKGQPSESQGLPRSCMGCLLELIPYKYIYVE